MDLETINSQDAVRLLQIVVSKSQFDPQTGARSGVPCLRGPCSVAGCLNYVSHLSQTQTCPLHQANLAFQDKHMAPFCSNCYHVFPLVHVQDPRHHCHGCGRIFCHDCSDYELLVPSALSGVQAHKTLWGAATSRSDRCCIKCSSLMHPSQYKRVSYDPIYHLTAHIPIDICFIFDGTASMINHISLVEREIGNIAADIRSHHYVDCHFMAAAYRDHAYQARLCNMIAPMRHEHHFARLIKHGILHPPPPPPPLSLHFIFACWILSFFDACKKN